MKDVIQSTKGKLIKRLVEGGPLKGFPADMVRRAEMKIALIDAAHDLEDLRLPPSNHLEKLRGGRKGQYSIRINGQWRICFLWQNNDAYDVEIVDYH